MYIKQFNRISSKITVIKLLNWILGLLIFVVIIDPTGQIFRMKEVLFVMLLGLYLIQIKSISINVPVLLLIFLVYIFFFLSYIWGVITGRDFDTVFTMGTLKSFLFLFVLLLCNDKRLNFFNKLIFPCIIISTLTIIIYIMFMYVQDEEFEIWAYKIIKISGDFIMISRRQFLGIELRQIFYKTSPILVLPFSVYLYKLLFEKKTISNIFLVLLFGIAILISTARANVLSLILITFIIGIMRMKKSKYGAIFFLLSLIFLAIFIFVALSKIFSDQEVSLETKTGHLYSLIDELNSFSTLLFGQGAGSLFYTISSREFIPQSELSYLEIIRMFGLFGGGALIFLFFYPLYLYYKNKPKYYMALIWGYLAYLFIGGTNPLLISSTGILALAIAYSSSEKDIDGSKSIKESFDD